MTLYDGCRQFPCVGRFVHVLRFVVVNIQHPDELVHASITRKHNGREKVMLFTLCDRRGERRVMGLNREFALPGVTCPSCRSQLIENDVIA